MVSFLIVLAFAPVLFGLTWMFTSPLARLDGYTPVKVIIRIVLAATMLGVVAAQFNFLGHNIPLSARRPYGTALLAIECIPMMVIMFYRDPSRNSLNIKTVTTMVTDSMLTPYNTKSVRCHMIW
jgi:hypothetical protein